MSAFLASLWWPVIGTAKRSSRHTLVAGAPCRSWAGGDGWGHCAPRGRGGGGGSDGAAATRLGKRVRLRLPPCSAGTGKGMLGIFPKSNPCCCPCHSPNVGGEGTGKSHFPCVHSAPLAFSPALVFPFIPSLHPFLFSLLLNGAI